MGCNQSSEIDDDPKPITNNHSPAVPNDYVDGQNKDGNASSTAIGVSDVTSPSIKGPADLSRELPPVPPQSPSPEDDSNVFLARFSYEARTSEDLSFSKGERLRIIGNTDGDWWMGKSLSSGKEGYIPRNYVAQLSSYESEE